MRLLAWMLAALIAIAGAAVPAAAQQEVRVEAPVIGLSIGIPSGWREYPPDETMRVIRRLDMKSPEVSAELARTEGPLITLLKPTHIGKGISPSIKIGYQAYPGAEKIGAVEIISRLFDAVKTGFVDAEMTAPPVRTTIGGFEAAYLRATYQVSVAGVRYDGVTELWVIPRGDHFIMIGAAYGPDEPEMMHMDISEAIASIRIAN